jgi:CPA2 family monovalent cation:H+ antiporter-2
VVVTLDDPDATARMVDAAKALRPDVCVLARARDPEHAAHLTRLGAVEVIPDAVEASLQLGARLLEQVGMPESVVLQRVARLRDQLNAPQPAEAP